MVYKAPYPLTKPPGAIKTHIKARTTPNLDPPARTAVTHNVTTECKEPPEYVVEKGVSDLHASEDLM